MSKEAAEVPGDGEPGGGGTNAFTEASEPAASASAVSQRGGPQRIPRPPGARAGGPPPWAGLSTDDRVVSLDRIRSVFRGRIGVGSAAKAERTSAVLAPFYELDGDVFVVLTRRAAHLRSHRGEVSFPGGAAELGESPQAAALRESDEEIGLDPASVEVLGELDHLTTFSSASTVVPYVGVLPERPELTANPAEVEAVLHVSVGELLLDEVYREEVWVFEATERSLFFFELVGDTVWGATAAILRQCLGLVLGLDTDLAHQ